MFTPGDEVICIRPRDKLELGRVYIIKSIHNLGLNIQLKAPATEGVWYVCDRFIPATSLLKELA